MPTFNLTIKLGNDAMQSGDDVARALRSVADCLANTYDSLTLPEDAGAIFDLNGNTVGRWEVAK